MIGSKWIFSLIFWISSSALAGGMEAGGGYGFLCFKDKSQAQAVVENEHRVPDELIDSIEEIVPQDLHVASKFADAIGSNLVQIREADLKTVLDEYLHHIAKAAPTLASKMRGYLESLQEQNVRFLLEIPQPDDFGVFYENDKGVSEIKGRFCVRVPLAVQFNSPGNESIHFDKRLYHHPAMSVKDQAVLWLHELLYMYARMERGHKRSTETTIALSYLLQKEGHFTKEMIQTALTSNKIL